MTDDLVKQSLAELHDIVRCRCHPAYTGRGMHDPDCECDSADAVKVVADRIEELETKLAQQDDLVDPVAIRAAALREIDAAINADDQTNAERLLRADLLLRAILKGADHE